MNTKPIIPVNYLNLLFEYIQLQRISLADVFTEEQLNLLGEACILEKTKYITEIQYAEILDRLAEYLHQPHLALDIVKMVNISHLGVLGGLLQASDTLGEVLRKLLSYGGLISTNFQHMEMNMQGNSIEVSWKNVELLNVIGTELSSAVLCQLGRKFIAQDEVLLNNISFSHPLRGDITPYLEFFQCPVQFDQPYTSFNIPLRVLDIPLHRPEKAFAHIIEIQAQKALQDLPEQDVFLNQAKAELIHLIEMQHASLDNLAAQFFMSARSLQRKLDRYSITFQQLLDKTRLELFNQYQKQGLTFNEIAQHLGFSNQSALTRAYKQWTGVTPTQKIR